MSLQFEFAFADVRTLLDEQLLDSVNLSHVSCIAIFRLFRCTSVFGTSPPPSLHEEGATDQALPVSEARDNEEEKETSIKAFQKHQQTAARKAVDQAQSLIMA